MNWDAMTLIWRHRYAISSFYAFHIRSVSSNDCIFGIYIQNLKERPIWRFDRVHIVYLNFVSTNNSSHNWTRENKTNKNVTETIYARFTPNSRGTWDWLTTKNGQTRGHAGVGRQDRMFFLCYSPECHNLLLNTREDAGLLAIEIHKLHDRF